MKELIKKIANAKKEIGKISKESTNPFFKSKYFDINALLEHTEEVLEKHGLLILQPISNNHVISQIYDIETGEKIESSIELPSINDPQKLGSAITYYRRYTLQSLLSMQAEDDDANKTVNKANQNNNSTKEQIEVWLSEKEYNGALKTDVKIIKQCLALYCGKRIDRKLKDGSTESKVRGMKKEYREGLQNKIKELENKN